MIVVSQLHLDMSSVLIWSKLIPSTIKIQYFDSSDFPFRLKNCPFVMEIEMFFNQDINEV